MSEIYDQHKKIEELHMTGIDLSVDKVKRRIEFKEPMTEPSASKTYLVQMAKESK